VPIYKKDALNLQKDFLDCLKKAGLSYLDKLSKVVQEGDDWSFIIKTHAFIEMIISESIIEHIGEKKLLGVIQKLPLSDGSTGKLAICKDLNILDDKQRTFIRFYSELRNKLVHKFENIDFSFTEYINTLDKQQLKTWKESIVWFPLDDKSKIIYNRMSIEDPRNIFYISIFKLAFIIKVDSSIKNGLRETNKLALETSETILENMLNNK
jgi:hypothetical protein